MNRITESRTPIKPAIVLAIAALACIATWGGATCAWGTTPADSPAGYLAASAPPAPEGSSDAQQSLALSVWQVGMTEVRYGETRVSVYALDSEDSNLAGAKVAVTVEGKTHTAKTNRNGKATVRIPVAKIGTKVTAKVTDRNGETLSSSTKIRNGKWRYSFYDAYTGTQEPGRAASAHEFFHTAYATAIDPYSTPYYKGDWDQRESFDYNVKIGTTYESNKATKVQAKFVTKGDRIELRFGGKTYVKKVGSSAKTLAFALPHKRFPAGTKIVATQFNKYGQKMGTAKSIVFGGKDPKVGMTEKEVRLLRLYGAPTGGSASTSGESAWYYTYDDGKKWNVIRFKNGRVVSFSR